MSIVIRNRLRKFYRGSRPKTMGLVGMNMSTFVDWIEYNFSEKMTWENHGSYWHIDHVVPCS